MTLAPVAPMRCGRTKVARKEQRNEQNKQIRQTTVLCCVRAALDAAAGEAELHLLFFLFFFSSHRNGTNGDTDKFDQKYASSVKSRWEEGEVWMRIHKGAVPKSFAETQANCLKHI